ncbi:MAG: YdeI/OmpD-associated family protein [Chitinophagaceae bacterium]
MEVFFPKDRNEWRKWLAGNHNKVPSVWIGYYKIKSGIPSILYDEAVEEALCFGWIDSKAVSIDEKSYKQYFTKRKPDSVWSRVNKEKIIKLIQNGLMTQAGLECIEAAKRNGSWTQLDDVENLVLPVGLIKEFEKEPEAYQYFQSLPRSKKRNLLQLIALAKLPVTKTKRIKETVLKAKQRLL